ncbi:ferredoxin [Streptomyces sp. NPDC057253]|uniref:ferredoxin n=1 Tax=Streptomyces sp. NPDC057253 TaxID=3346069 RepID=UPI00362BD023
MKVVVDPRLCSGHARCHATAPEVFELDDLGYSALASSGEVLVAPEHEEAARDGARACPERAITLIDQTTPHQNRETEDHS